jgi:RNA polymerase sigma-70 factor (ECF subfamily)
MAAPAQPDDDQTLTAIANGDRLAFEALWTRYHQRVYAFVARTVRRPELVDELVNDVFLAVWRSASAFAGRSQVPTWILGIAYRQALKAAEKWGRTGGREVSLEVELSAPRAADADFADREVAAVVRGCLRELPAEQRAVLELVVNQGLGYAEIAGIVGCPEGTVKTRMFHARRRLREALVARGVLAR